MKELAGVLVKDLGRYAALLASRRTRGYLRLRNRAELLVPAPDGRGYLCDWRWTSDLHAPRHLPILGRWIIKAALEDHPIEFKESSEEPENAPDISFIIGHRGLERLPLLLKTIDSIAASAGAVPECVVVEQDMHMRLTAKLPAWVRLIHTPPPDTRMPYCRSWAFNVGARAARAPVLVLHDSDLLVPRDYAACILAHVAEGSELVNLKRFIFYLSASHTRRLLEGCAQLTSSPPESTMQNSEGGGSVAITRRGFDRIGGMDESFIGWGGEDNEFWERCKTLPTWPYGYLSLVHLWHAPQPGRGDPSNPMPAHYRTLSAQPAASRIARLRANESGELAGPSGWTDPGRGD